MTGYLSKLPTDVTSGLMRMSRQVEESLITQHTFIHLNTNLCFILEPITRGRTKRREADSWKSYGRFGDCGKVEPEGTQMTHQALEGNIST